jgi:hypothetical protein
MELASDKRVWRFFNQTQANKARTGRWGFCGIFKHFPRFKLFLLPNRIHARPSANNATRYAAS